VRDARNTEGILKEYWMFTLFSVIFLIVASILDAVVFGASTGGVGPLYMIYSLAVLIPSWAVSIRRLHDVGKSGWFSLILLVPLVGAIWILILVCTDSQPGENQYGPNPKAA